LGVAVLAGEIEGIDVVLVGKPVLTFGGGPERRHDLGVMTVETGLDVGIEIIVRPSTRPNLRVTVPTSQPQLLLVESMREPVGRLLSISD